MWRSLGEPAATHQLPARVVSLIRAQEEVSERLIGWVQLGLVTTFAALFLIAPRPADAPMRMLLEPVPVTLAAYFLFTTARLVLSYRGRLPPWLLVVSILADTALLLGLIWWFHIQYEQPAAFSLKVPTFIYIFVFIALRALRFDYRYLLTVGLAAAIGWAGFVIFAVVHDGGAAITRNFVTYLTSNRILVGAEFDKVFTILMVTAVLTIAVRRAHDTLVTAVREETAGREVRRFLSEGVAEAITRAETVVEAGEAVEREAAILMLDIRGFTRFSTTVPPKDVVQVLTSFHGRVVPLIQRHGGVIDKFLGDGVMATFGAVEVSQTAAADAIRALEAILVEGERWHETLVSRGISTPLAVNGAVAAGPVVFATLGSGDRLEYTVIGEAVNLAAKLEKHNKAEGTRGLVVAQTYERAVAQGYTPDPTHVRRPGAQVAGAVDPIDLIVLAR